MWVPLVLVAFLQTGLASEEQNMSGGISMAPRLPTSKCVETYGTNACRDEPQVLFELAARAGQQDVHDCAGFIAFLEDATGEDGCLTDLSDFESGYGMVYEVCPQTCQACCTLPGIWLPAATDNGRIFTRTQKYLSQMAARARSLNEATISEFLDLDNSFSSYESFGSYGDESGEPGLSGWF